MFLSHKILFPTVILVVVTFYILTVNSPSVNVVVSSLNNSQNNDIATPTILPPTNPSPTILPPTEPSKASNPGEIACYKAKDQATIDILDYNEPPKDKSIFFHETSCKSSTTGQLVINNRQACAVESAALLNPNFQVFLLFLSPGVFPSEATESRRYLEALLSYPNIRIRHVNYGDYVEATPVEALYRDGLIEHSNYPLIHASDVIRYLTLWRFGGIYMDLDVVVTKSLEALALNYAGQESGDYVASGVLSFDSSGIGHEWAMQCLEELQQHYDGRQWSYNGPGVVSRFFQRLCNTRTVAEALSTKDGSCDGYKVYPKDYFYPVHWSQWRMYFDERYSENVERLTKDSYAIHVWNKLSKLEKAPLNSTGAYVRFARQFCPRVFAQCLDVF